MVARGNIRVAANPRNLHPPLSRGQRGRFDDACRALHARHLGTLPFKRIPGDLDIDLPDGTADDEYLAALATVLPTVLRQAAPDLVVYLAGADPHEDDRLGRLRLTFDGLARRDYMVLEACCEVGIPVAITIAGGYGRCIDNTVQVHVNTVHAALAFV